MRKPTDPRTTLSIRSILHIKTDSGITNSFRSVLLFVTRENPDGRML
jgi:hypothetical protein